MPTYDLYILKQVLRIIYLYTIHIPDNLTIFDYRIDNLDTMNPFSM